MYVCGITPYDATHLGHAATYVAFDLVNRAWLDAGHDVHYVQNVTDVDDPLLERAGATARTGRELADRETDLFREDMTALRVLPPRDYIGAVEAIPPLIVDLVGAAADSGAAYELGRRRLLRRRRRPARSAESGLDARHHAALFAERGGDPDRPGKKDPLDRLLWLAAGPASRRGTAAARPGPPWLAHRVRRDRPRPPRHGPSTSRAAAPTWSSRTTR